MSKHPEPNKLFCAIFSTSEAKKNIVSIERGSGGFQFR